MPKISDARREERRAHILAAAAACFRRSGFQRTSMADIIEESGLSAGAIYGYFAGKQELLRAVAEETLGDRLADLGMDADGTPAPRSPRELARTIIDGLRAAEKLPLLVQTWGESVADPEIRTIVNTIVPLGLTMIEQSLRGWAQSHPDDVSDDLDAWVRRTATLIIALMQGFAVQSTLFAAFDAEVYLDAVADALPG